MKDLNFFGGKNCNNEDYVCHTEWPSASSLHAANLEIRWVYFLFYVRNKSVNCTWEWRLLRQLLQLPTRFSDSDELISFQCHLVMPLGYRLRNLCSFSTYSIHKNVARQLWMSWCFSECTRGKWCQCSPRN